MNPLPSTILPLLALAYNILPVSAQTAPVTSDGPYVNRNLRTSGGYDVSVIGCNAVESLVHGLGFSYLAKSDGGSYYTATPPVSGAVPLIATAPVPGAVPLLTATNGNTIVLALNFNVILGLGSGWINIRQVGWAFDHAAYTNVVPVYQAHLNPDGNAFHRDYFYTENKQEWLDHWANGWKADGTIDNPPIAFWAPLTKDATNCFPGEPPPTVR